MTTALPAAARLAWWGTAWLRGQVVTDLLLDAVSGDEASVYKARLPVFKAVPDATAADSAQVQVLGVVESEAPAEKRYEPGHPLADAQGYVYAPNVNVVEELVSMIETQRAYEMNSKAISTTDQMLEYLTSRL